MRETVELGPKPEGSNKDRAPCPGLMRLFGMAGFLIVGLSTLRAAARAAGIEDDLWQISTWNTTHVLVLWGSIAAGVLGGLIGAAAGVSIPVRDIATCEAVTVLWHSTFTASAVWIVAALYALRKAWGIDQLVAYVHQPNNGFVGRLIWSGALCGLAIGVLWIVSRAIPVDGKIRSGRFVGAAAAGAAALGLWAHRVWQLPAGDCIVCAVVFTVGLVQACAFLIGRDRRELKQFRRLQ